MKIKLLDIINPVKRGNSLSNVEVVVQSPIEYPSKGS